MSGVINIITKKGKKGEQRRTVDDRGRQLRHGSGHGHGFGLDRQLDLFARRDRHVHRRLSGLWLPRQPAAVDRRRRHAAASAAEHAFPSDKGGVERRLHLHDLADRERRFRVQRASETICSFATPARSSPSDVFTPYNNSTTWIGDGFVRANVDLRRHPDQPSDGLRQHDGLFRQRLTEAMLQRQLQCVQLHELLPRHRAGAPNIRAISPSAPTARSSSARAT